MKTFTTNISSNVLYNILIRKIRRTRGYTNSTLNLYRPWLIGILLAWNKLETCVISAWVVRPIRVNCFKGITSILRRPILRSNMWNTHTSTKSPENNHFGTHFDFRSHENEILHFAIFSWNNFYKFYNTIIVETTFRYGGSSTPIQW